MPTDLQQLLLHANYTYKRGLVVLSDKAYALPLAAHIGRPGETSLWHRHSENTLYMCVGHGAAALNRPTDKVRPCFVPTTTAFCAFFSPLLVQCGVE